MLIKDPNSAQDILCAIPVDPVSKLPAPTYTQTDVCLGAVFGVVPFSFSGIKLGISDVTAQPIEAVSTTLAAMSGVAMDIRSSSAADVGVQVRIAALGPNGVYLAPFIVTLNGTTPVATGMLSRINSLYRISGNIAGNVTVQNGANVHGFMEVGAQIMRSAAFSIPAGYRMSVQTVIAAMLKAGGNDAGVTFSLQMKPMASSVFGPIISLAAYRAGNSQIQATQDYTGGTVGPFDVRVVGIGSQAGCDGQVYVSGFLTDLASRP